MADAKVETTISGGEIYGIAGAGSVVIENFTIYNHALEPVAPADTTAEPIPPSPYPGLAYFGPGDADLFFGRDTAIDRLVEAVGRQSLTALVGASGSGKSSVVLAGLAPRLHRSGGWRFSHFRLGTELERNPFLALARGLVPLYVTSQSDTERLRNTRQLATSLEAGELTLRDVFADCRKHNKDTRILLIADQFEEAFTLIEDEAMRSRFVNTLLDGFTDQLVLHHFGISLLLTMRADFYGHALRYRPLADALQGRVENLGPMDREELHAAIIRPAENRKVSFEPGLVQTLLDEVQSKPGALPLLQFALREMWGRQAQRQITRKVYDEIGGVKGALAKRAEQIFTNMTSNRKDANAAVVFRKLFTRLVGVGEDVPETRRVVGADELDLDTWVLAQELAGEENRLVVISASTPDHQTVELVHEALIVNWPTLNEWVRSDRPFHYWLRALKPRVDEWLKQSDDEGTLLLGGPLGVAEEWLEKRRDDLNSMERAYIAASLENKEARRRREQDVFNQERMRLAEIETARKRTRALQIIAVALAVTAVIGPLVWWYRVRLNELAYQLLYVNPLTIEKERDLQAGDKIKECADCPQLVVVPPGIQTIGALDAADEQPPHIVSIAVKFAVGLYEVTFAEWDVCVKYGGCAPGVADRWGRGRYPLINISWDDAKQYVEWLERITGRPYRLLSEAEWEYVARTQKSPPPTYFSFGNRVADLEQEAWYEANSGGQAHTVGLKRPNAFQIYDMRGNVSEWVEDCYHENYLLAAPSGTAWTTRDCGRHVIRGGAYLSRASMLRSSARAWSNKWGDSIGLRVARTLRSQ